MTTPNRSPEDPIDPLALAPGLALVTSGGVMILAAFGWGAAGLRAAVVGVLLSLVNVWALHRFSRRAAAQAASGGPNTAMVQLTAALGAKTALLFTAVWLLTRTAHLDALPFGLGLLVSVFSLLGAGLWTTMRGESI
jgi:hypothetical protein